jgi:hypothetical protein
MSPFARRLIVGTLYSVMGVAALVGAFLTTPQVPVSLTYWAVFAVFAVIVFAFSIGSAEVDDRMLVSSTPMVLMTAAGLLSSPAIDPSIVASPVLPVTLLAVVGFYTRGDFADRQFFRATVNFGLLAMVGFASATVFQQVLEGTSAVLLDSALATQINLSARSLAVITGAVAGVAAGVTYALTNYVTAWFAVGVLYGRDAHIPWTRSAAVVGSIVLQAWLGSVLGVLLALRPSIALVVMTLTVFLIGHLVFVSQATLRATHESFLRGFVKILETRDLYTRGHTERVVDFALAIGDELGLSSRQLARLRLAALIHDVGKLAVPTEIMRKQGSLTDEEFHSLRVATHKVDDLLSEVSFLDPMVTIYSGCHPKWDGEDFGQARHVHTRVPTVEQSVLAVADAFDAMTSTRSYRMAMTQSEALTRLSASTDPLFDSAVVTALRRALDRRGGSYGPPEMTPPPSLAGGRNARDV